RPGEVEQVLELLDGRREDVLRNATVAAEFATENPALGGHSMVQNYWSVICPETEAPGLWKTWLSEKCVAIGWPPSRRKLDGPTDSPGWDIARIRAQQIAPGDIVIPYLLRYRFGIPGEVLKVAIEDSEWRPTVPKGGYARNPDEAELGRRIEVRWLQKDAPPLDKIALVPKKMQTPGGEFKKTIQSVKPERYSHFMGIISNPANWIAYEEGDSPTDAGSVEQTDPSSEPDEVKLSILETQVRSILAKNLHTIEPGLRQHPDYDQLEEVTFDLGRLDLLCIDAKQKLTIIELQKGYLNEGHIGKVCRYYGWFAAKHGDDKVRVVLLFENAASDLVDAYKKA